MAMEKRGGVLTDLFSDFFLMLIRSDRHSIFLKKEE
jgi:hypothetical protein